MPLVLTCPRGHRVELPTDVGEVTSDRPLRCPECGDEIARPTASGEEQAAVPTRSDGTPPAPVPPPPALPGYEQFEWVGQGGMGVVYRARQVHLDLAVAIKVLPVDAHSPALAERFVREARALARLGHPNITTVHDFGQIDGQSYIVMEFVEGTDLRERMLSGPVPLPEARTVALQLCDALQYAHEEGVIHRDIKPENILLDRRGRVKVADFGIAKLLTGGPTAQTLTHTQQVLGTLHYMAPEQLEGARDVDHRADLYAVGVLLYEMLTGRRPIGRFPPPSSVAGVDPRFDPIVLKMLEREPADRYQDAGSMKADLEQMETAPVAAGPKAPDDDNAAALTEVQQALPRPPVASLRPLRLPAVLVILLGLAHLAAMLPFLVERFQWHQQPLAAILAEIALPVYGAFLVLAGFAAWRGQRYRLVNSAAYALMLPQPAWPLSLPLGWWLTRRLREEPVREVFRQQEEARRLWSQDWRRALLGSGTTWVVFFLVAAYLQMAWPWAELQIPDADDVTHTIRTYAGFGSWMSWPIAVATVALAGLLFRLRFDRVVSLPRGAVLLGFGACVGVVGLWLVFEIGPVHTIDPRKADAMSQAEAVKSIEIGPVHTIDPRKADAMSRSKTIEIRPVFRTGETLDLTADVVGGNLVALNEKQGKMDIPLKMKMPSETFQSEQEFRHATRLACGTGGYLVLLLGLAALALGATDLWLQGTWRRLSAMVRPTDDDPAATQVSGAKPTSKGETPAG